MALKKQPKAEKSDSGTSLDGAVKSTGNSRSFFNFMNFVANSSVVCFLYHKCYLTGIAAFRFFRFINRRIASAFGVVLAVFFGFIHFLVHLWFRLAYRFYDKNRKAILAYFDGIKTIPQVIRKKAIEEKKALQAGKDVFQIIIPGVTRVAVRAVSYVLPVVAVVFLFHFISNWHQDNFVVEVQYNNQSLGYVESESVFTQAADMMESRVINYDTGGFSLSDPPQFKLVKASQIQLLAANDLCDKLITSLGDKVSEANGVYVNSKLVGAVADRKPVDDALNAILAQYKTGDSSEQVSFLQKVEIVPGLYPVESVKDGNSVLQTLTSQVVGEVTYKVCKGDTVSGIAAKYNTTSATLFALNPNVSEKTLQLDTNLVVSQAKPFLNVQVSKTISYQENIAYDTEKREDSSQYTSYSKVTQKGQQGLAQVTAQVVYVDGYETQRTVTNTQVITPPVTQILTVGTKSAPKATKPSVSSGAGPSVASGQFMWPVNGGYISCGWYGYAGHTGADIAAPRGTDIYAADSGVVVLAVNGNTGYGRHIVIDHGNGYSTLYGHCNKLYVTAGQTVSKGQKIAEVGDSGHAFGTHCHFEVWVNGVKVNPKPYIT